MKPIVTLTTDWNKHDFYAGAFKGKLLKAHDDAHIIEITHQIKPLHVPEAAFILANTYPHFPQGTIHVMAVKSLGHQQHPILVVHDGHYFLGNDNGVFGLIFQQTPEQIIRIDQPNPLPTFPAAGVFAEVASQLISGKSPDEFGPQQPSFYKRIPLRPTIDESVIIGRIVYIDSFDNAITNISKDLFAAKLM